MHYLGYDHKQVHVQKSAGTMEDCFSHETLHSIHSTALEKSFNLQNFSIIEPSP